MMCRASGWAGSSHHAASLFGPWRHRRLIGQLVVRELEQRYRGSYFGILWSFFTPVLMLSVYTFVFSTIFAARWGGHEGRPILPAEFALTTFAAMIPFGVFADVVNRAPALIVNVPNYVKKVIFPLDVLPVVLVVSALVQGALNLVVLTAAVGLLAGGVPATIVYLPIVAIPLVLLCLGLAWLLSSLGVFLRDVGQVTGLATQVLFFLSPVFYPVSAIPERARQLLLVNPLTTILEDFRRTLLWNQPPAWGPWGLWTAAMVLVAIAGHHWFARTRRAFADVL